MANKLSRFRRIREGAQALWDESALKSHTELSKVEKFAHFCVMVWRSFVRNRCPVRASALAYATLLAMIPMLAVVMSVTSSFLKKEGEDRIDQFIVRIVAAVTPPAMITTNVLAVATNGTAGGTNFTAASNEASATNSATAAPVEPENGSSSATTNESVLPSFANEEQTVKARKEIARRINQFIQNTRSGTLGVTGSVLLIFVGISMLSRIEETFNDIWGVKRGRSWFTRLVLYWGVISLAPLLMVVAFGLATGPHLAGTKKLLTTMPIVSHLMFQILPIVVLCLTLSLFYMLIPNTKVRWRAALVGGLVAGVLWHLNNAVSVLYVSRVVSNSRIYGSLGLVPVFMIGLYCSWLILLFGAQVAYAFQNRATYVEEKQVENINQRGREFVALRLMTCIGQRFLRGQPPATDVEIGQELSVPTRLVLEIMNTLCAARLVVEAVGAEPAYLPARPLENITCHDILLAMRTAQGQELTTRDGVAVSQVYGEFHRIEEAERHAASSVTMLALASRGQKALE
jgi:membrane protein